MVNHMQIRPAPGPGGQAKFSKQQYAEQLYPQARLIPWQQVEIVETAVRTTFLYQVEHRSNIHKPGVADRYLLLAGGAFRWT